MTVTDKFDDSETVQMLLENLKSGRASIQILERNKNLNFLSDYRITDQDEMSIIRKLTLADYKESIFYTYGNLAIDKLHIFKHNEMLLPINGNRKKRVTLYIKLGTVASEELKNKLVIVVSFHEAEYE